MDALSSVEISCKLHERWSELPQAAPSKVSKSPLFLGKSRTLLKVVIFDFRELSWFGFELRLNLIAES